MQEARPGILRTKKKLLWKDDWVWFNEVEKGGIFSLLDLYMHMFHWFQKEQFVHWQTHNKNIEDIYIHRMRPDGKQENIIWWRAYRRINKYVSYLCQLDLQNFGSQPTEVMHNGKKVKADKAGVVLRLWWWVQYDAENNWEKSMLGNMKKFFFTYLLHNEMEHHRDKLRVIAKRFENEVKQFWEITTDINMPRSFFPEEGYKWKRPEPRPQDYEKMRRQPDEPVI